MNHLFLACFVIVAASVVLVLNARDDAATLDRRLGISPVRAGPSPAMANPTAERI